MAIEVRIGSLGPVLEQTQRGDALKRELIAALQRARGDACILKKFDFSRGSLTYLIDGAERTVDLMLEKEGSFLLAAAVDYAEYYGKSLINPNHSHAFDQKGDPKGSKACFLPSEAPEIDTLYDELSELVTRKHYHDATGLVCHFADRLAGRPPAPPMTPNQIQRVEDAFQDRNAKVDQLQRHYERAKGCFFAMRESTKSQLELKDLELNDLASALPTDPEAKRHIIVLRNEITLLKETLGQIESLDWKAIMTAISHLPMLELPKAARREKEQALIAKLSKEQGEEYAKNVVGLIYQHRGDYEAYCLRNSIKRVNAGLEDAIVRSCFDDLAPAEIVETLGVDLRDSRNAIDKLQMPFHQALIERLPKELIAYNHKHVDAIVEKLRRCAWLISKTDENFRDGFALVVGLAFRQKDPKDAGYRNVILNNVKFLVEATAKPFAMTPEEKDYPEFVTGVLTAESTRGFTRWGDDNAKIRHWLDRAIAEGVEELENERAIKRQIANARSREQMREVLHQITWELFEEPTLVVLQRRLAAIAAD